MLLFSMRVFYRVVTLAMMAAIVMSWIPSIMADGKQDINKFLNLDTHTSS